VNVFETREADFILRGSFFHTVSRSFIFVKEDDSEMCLGGLLMLKYSMQICVQPTGCRVVPVASLGVKHLAVRHVLQNINEYPSLGSGTEDKMGGICSRHGGEGVFIHNFYWKT
jgi:hypothetical protein